MYSTWICVKLCLVENTHHRCPGARQSRRARIAFYSVVIPLMSSQVSRFQVLETGTGVALYACRFILNI